MKKSRHRNPYNERDAVSNQGRRADIIVIVVAVALILALMWMTYQSNSSPAR